MAPSVADAAKTCRRRLEVAPTAVEAAAALILVRIGLWTMPFAMLSRVVERICARRRQGADGGADRIGRIVVAVSRRLPLRTTCLVEAIAARAMLRRRGIDSTLRFGVRSGTVGGRAIDAHAWLECGGRVVVGEIDDGRGYAALEPTAREDAT